MASFNQVILIGNLTRDPELRQTQSGVSVCQFTLAVSRRYGSHAGNGQDNQQTADFLTVVAWRQTAEFVCRYFKKGRPMLVRGQLQSRSWTDKDGGKRYATEVIADDITFVDSKSDNAGNDSGAPAGGGYVPDAYATPSFSNTNAGNFEPVNADDDSLPF